MKKLAVVALGGNALIRGDEIGTIQQQEQNTYKICLNLIELLNNEYRIVITHGNGPQVGNILLRNEAGYNQFKVPKMPLDICVADSQGGIGYMIERQLRNILTQKNINIDIASVITQVLVDFNDEAFKNPTKPIGAFYLKEEADLLTRINNWNFKEDPRKRGWRRIVASPKPLEIINKKVIKDLLLNDNIVIALGGGGIPVYKDDKGNLTGTDAVIDKDSASSLLAKEIEAESLIILTDVSKVYLNYHKPNQKSIDVLTIDEALKYYDEGEFASGSMAPKILAAVNFIKNGGKEALITEASKIVDKNAGTKIIAK